MTTSTLPHDLADAADRLERLSRRLGEDHGPLLFRLRGHASRLAATAAVPSTKAATAALRALHAKRKAIKAQLAERRP